MKPPSLRSRIRNGTLLMLVIVIAIAALAVPTVHRLGYAIRRTLYRNYLSIAAAEQMHSALYAIQLGLYEDSLNAVLPPNRDRFTHWLNLE
ncbi:MAG: hypothetical protein ABSG46_02145, partial [Candidatus Binataceae bacterium]